MDRCTKLLGTAPESGQSEVDFVGQERQFAQISTANLDGYSISNILRMSRPLDIAVALRREPRAVADVPT